MQMLNLIRKLVKLVLFVFILSFFVGFGYLKYFDNIEFNDTKSTNNLVIEPKIILTDPIEYIEKLDYTQMTKSKIQNRINELTSLIATLETWEGPLEVVLKQAQEELLSAQSHLDEGNYLYPYTEEDLLLLSYMIEIEAGANIAKDEEQCLVACVIINRRNQGGINKRLANPTIKDVINEAGQYSICKYSRELGRNTFYVDVDTVNMDKVSDRHRENARKVLEGEFTCPENVLFQATFKQGKGIYKTFYHEIFNNTTYFCYG